MEQSPSEKLIVTELVYGEIALLLWNQKADYSIHENPPWDAILILFI
jgi:hypothetical protein